MIENNVVVNNTFTKYQEIYTAERNSTSLSKIYVVLVLLLALQFVLHSKTVSMADTMKTDGQKCFFVIWVKWTFKRQAHIVCNMKPLTSGGGGEIIVTNKTN